MIGWAASYMGNDNVWSQFVSPDEALVWDDSQIVKRLWDLMNAAEIIAGHNVNGFDFKRANTRFKKHNLPFITGKKTIDTLQLARSKLAFENNTLDYIAHELGLDGKNEITNKDWLAAHGGNKEAIAKIHTYCKKDVTEGKRVLSELLPLANKRFNFGALKKPVNDGELE
jgi:DNA polymerase III epsilon subunit-like protein